jgi:hypothetical protein
LPIARLLAHPIPDYIIGIGRKDGLSSRETHHAVTAENMVKLVRFDGGKTGLMVQLVSGLYIIDVIGSLGVFSPGDPVSQGILNGILKDRGSWAALIEHWEQARTGLRRLASIALANPDRPRLVMFRADEVSLAPSKNPGGIAALEIVESCEVARDPTGRETMQRQFVVLPPADTQVTSIIPFRDKIRSAERSHVLQDS